jgi:predicted DNA-binding transcriptional regulator AlpA
VRRAEAAKLIGISTPTLDRWDSLGLLPRGLKLAGTKSWRRAELLAWVEAGCPDRRTWESTRKAAR